MLALGDAPRDAGYLPTVGDLGLLAGLLRHRPLSGPGPRVDDLCRGLPLRSGFLLGLLTVRPFRGVLARSSSGVLALG